MNKELLLVKLPKIPNCTDEYFGIGYYTDHGFSFAIVTEKMMHMQSLRHLPFPKDDGYLNQHEIEILGIIKEIPKCGK